ncbi:MAG: hypothetical protein AAGF11_23190 [Myxococcota bacterium]
MRITDILGEQIEQADFGEALEEFFGVLLRDEQRRRHPAAKVHGPGKPKAGDGGRDLVLEVADPPTKRRDAYLHALTSDVPGKTWYSCKAGHSWRTGVDKDLKIPRVREAKGQNNKGVPKPVGSRDKRPVRELLEHLSAGGRYVVVTDQWAGDNQADKLINEVSEAVEFWLGDAGLEVPSGLREHLALIEASKLAAHLRYHRPRLPLEYRQRLGIRDFPGLKGWEQWTSELSIERGLPSYVPDAKRDRIIQAIDDSVGRQRVLRVVGPPGVGKTRLVHEALSRLDSPSASVLYTSDPDDGHRAIEQGWLSETRDVALVIDEVRTSDVTRAAPRFVANGTDSLLILVGTSDSDPAQKLPHLTGQFLLDRLDPRARRTLAARELGVGESSPDQRLQSVVRLAEGYPLFTVLLARALVEDGDALLTGHDETSRWDAAKRVIAGPKRDYGGNESHWDREALIRAKCLLVAILTGGLDLGWRDLWDQHGERLQQAIDAPTDWSLVKEAETSCIKRQILRRADSGRHYRYVSPNNLARIIINHFIGPPDGLGPRIVRHVPELRAQLFEVARRVEATPALNRLAKCELEEFERRDTDEPLDALTSFASSEAVYAAARVLPEQAARHLSDLLLRWDNERFELAKDLRSTLTGVLEHLARRKLTVHTFARLEAALFRLARSEFEPWGNNAAGIWQSLFMVALSCTHQPWAARFAMLKARLAEDEPSWRLLALGGLEAAIAPHEQGLGYSPHDLADGRWPVPTEDEYHARKLEAWRLLLEVTRDPSTEISGPARALVSDDLRGALASGHITAGDGILEALAAEVSRWGREQKTVLLGTIADIQRYDRDETSEEIAGLLRAIEAALAPADFGERLSNQVGDWHPGALPIDEEQRPQSEMRGDDELVDEALGSPSLLQAEFDWLTSAEALRRHEFLYQLGARDERRAFLPLLEAHAVERETSVLLVPYLIGWSESAGSVALQPWLDRVAEDPRFDLMVAEVLGRVDIDEHSVERLRTLLRRAPVPASSLLPMRYRLEGSSASAEALLSLLEEFLSTETALEAGLPLANHLLHQALPKALDRRVVEQTERLLRAVGECNPRGAMTEALWSAVAKAMVAKGEISVSVDAALAMVRQRSMRGEHLLEWLLDQGHAAPVWSAITAALEQPLGFELQWTLQRIKLTDAVPAELVLAWVGSSASRGQAVARLVELRDSTLAPLPQELLRRFGATGPVARELESRALSTPRAVEDIIEFYEQQRARAGRWAADPEPHVRAWAQQVIEQLEQTIADEQVEQEARRQYA